MIRGARRSRGPAVNSRRRGRFGPRTDSELLALAYWIAVDIARAYGFPAPSLESYGLREKPRRPRACS